MLPQRELHAHTVDFGKVDVVQADALVRTQPQPYLAPGRNDDRVGIRHVDTMFFSAKIAALATDARGPSIMSARAPAVKRAKAPAADRL